MVDILYHDLAEIGDIHIPHDLEYADQLARKAAAGLESKHLHRLIRQLDDKSYWIVNQVTPSVLIEPALPPSPIIGDIGKVLGVVTDGDGYLKYNWVAGASTVTFNDIYGNESGTHTININDGDMLWGLNGANSFSVNLSTASDNEGFHIGNGTDFVFIKRGGSNTINIESEVSSFGVNGAIFNTLWSSHFSLVGTGISNISTVKAQGASADLVLGARGQTITLNQLGDTIYDGTATSIIGALNENKSIADGAAYDISIHNLNAAYNVDVGIANILLNKGDIKINGSGGYSFVVDMTNTGGTADGVQFTKGADYFNLISKGVDLLDLEATLQAVSLASSTAMTFTPTGNYVVSGQSIVSLGTTANNVSLHTTTSGNVNMYPAGVVSVTNNTAYSSAPVSALSCSRNSTIGHAWVQSMGTLTAQPLLFNPNGGGITCFEGVSEGTTPEAKIYGYRTGDLLRAFEIGVGIDAPDSASFNGVGHFRFDGLVEPAKGRNMSSANDMVAPEGNSVTVIGNTQINTVDFSNIQSGTFVTFKFSSNPIVKHATAGTGTQFYLAELQDFATTAGAVLTVFYDGNYLVEVGRTIF